LTEEEAAELLRRAGIRPAWQGTREARPGYQQQQSPAGAMADPRTVPYRRVPTRRDREFSRASLQDTTQRGAYSEPRNQFAEAGMNVLETTGAPSFARGVRSIQANEPGRAAGEFAMGGLGLLGTATLPFGSGARAAPPRVPRIQQAPFNNGTFYHGTREAWDEGSLRVSETGRLGPGVYVTPSRENATNYSRSMMIHGREPGEVLQTQIRGRIASYDQFSRLRDRHTPAEAVRRLQEQGYSGVRDRRTNEIAIFDPNNVRASRTAPPRVPRIQQAMPEAQGIPNAPPRLPTRATDGSVLPIRQPEPIRQSLVGGSDDLREAAGMRPAGGGRVQAYRGSVVPYEGNNGIQFWSADPDIASSNAFGEGANVTRADLDLGRTLDVDGRLRPWDDLDPEGISDEALRREFAQRVHTMDPSTPTGAYGWFDVRTTDRLGQLARRHGYDSVTLRNVIEGGAPLENGAPRPTTTYAIAGDRARFAAPEAARLRGDGTVRAVDASDLFSARERPPPMFPGGRNR